MDFVLGPGYRGIKPCPINYPAFLQRNDDARKLGTLRLMECDAVAQPHAIEQRLRYIDVLACIEFNHSVVIVCCYCAGQFSQRAILNAFFEIILSKQDVTVHPDGIDRKK